MGTRAARDSGEPDLSRYGRLAEYQRKRRFNVTPEPAARPTGARARAAGRPRQLPREFVVQKHRASQLHYDFRLEHDGVMLSWAIPKGPSLDPAVKRLAMQVEPHPLDYNQFEGVIPEGEYGGGTVMIWDRGTWTPEDPDVDAALARGELKLSLRGTKLRGSWVLVRTGRGGRQWLLIKHRGMAASTEDVTVTRPRSAVSRRTLAAIARAAGASPAQLAAAAAADPPVAAARPRRATGAAARGAARRLRRATGASAGSAKRSARRSAPRRSARRPPPGGRGSSARPGGVTRRSARR
jgi:bifunctional non-homologous end joining protein LigD